MARLIGPSEASREVKTIVTSFGPTKGLFKSKAGRPATFYADQAATTLADIRTLAGAVIPDATVTIDAYSMLPEIQFPDGVDVVYVTIDGGPVWPVYAREDDRLDALGVALAAKETPAGAQAKADEAESDAVATAVQRTNHTGTQAISTVTGLQTALDAKAAAARQIATSGPLTGGGDLTENRTIGLLTHRAHLTATGEFLADDPYFGTPKTAAAMTAVLDAAEEVGLGTQIRLGQGVYEVGPGISMSGRSSRIVGVGAGSAATAGQITVIKASSQAGPVLDYRGYVDPISFRGRVTPLSHVTIQGSGTADATKANAGLKFGSLSSVYFHDIAVMGTGGPCVDMATNPGDAVYLCSFARFTLTPPVNAGANDVPWLYTNENNGTVLREFGFRGPSGTDHVGVSGAVVIDSNSSYRTYQMVLDTWWFEYVRPANGGCIVSIRANGTQFREPMFYDCTKQDAGHTETAFVRYLPTPTQDGGGNMFTGLVPGHETAAITIDTGIDLRQSCNTVIGPKGYYGNNVTLASGVDHSTVWLTGGYVGNNTPGWTDNSGMTNNRLIDDYLNLEVHPDGRTAGGIKRSRGSGSPESAVVGNIGDEYTRTDVGARYVKFKNAAANTGWGATVLENLGTASIGASQALPFANNTSWKITLTGSFTFTSITNARQGATLTLMLTQDATGSRTVTWPANLKWTGGVAPTLSTAAGVTDVLVLMYDGANWRETSRSLGTPA